MTSEVTVAKYPSTCRDTVSCARSLTVAIGERNLKFPWLPAGGADLE